MKHFARDFSVGLCIAVPVIAAAGLGVHEVLELKRDNSELEARRLDAVREKESAVRQLAGLQLASQPSLENHLREAARTADTRGASEEQLRQIIEFLKKEVATSEAALKEAREGRGGGAGHDHQSQLLAEISRLNSEIEQLREERDRWKKAAEKP